LGIAKIHCDQYKKNSGHTKNVKYVAKGSFRMTRQNKNLLKSLKNIYESSWNLFIRFIIVFILLIQIIYALDFHFARLMNKNKFLPEPLYLSSYGYGWGMYARIPGEASKVRIELKNGETLHVDAKKYLGGIKGSMMYSDWGRNQMCLLNKNFKSIVYEIEPLKNRKNLC
jgi:hypothetical protein